VRGREPAEENDMLPQSWGAWIARPLRLGVAPALVLGAVSLLPAQDAKRPSALVPPIISTRDPEVVPASFQPGTTAPSIPTKDPSPLPGEHPLPINLATALRLANVRPLDIAVALERVDVAAAQLDRARFLWLPTVYVGADYFRHDGRIQDVTGNLFDTSKASLMVGAGPSVVFALTDALFAPLAAKQVVAARQASARAAANDSLLAVAEAYFNVQQARGELAGAEDALARSADLVKRAEQLASGLAPPVEATRARTELARRKQAVQAARERWRTASADLARLLRLEPTVLVDPQEPPQMQVCIVPGDRPVDDLIPVALTSRPELAAQQALVRAALERLRQEKMRPLLPSVLLRGASTPVTGTLAGGTFGGGLNDSLNHFGARGDFDLQLLWEFQNLGFGNRARVAEQRAEHQLALLEAFRLQDRVAAEVVQAHAQVVSAAERSRDAEQGLKDALDSVEKNFEGLGQTKRAGNLVLLVVRPAEAVAAVQALATAYNDYYAATADFNRAQFRLYRALGQPAQLVLGVDTACEAPAPPLSVSDQPR
jgi:outer membrane protein TolC